MKQGYLILSASIAAALAAAPALAQATIANSGISEAPRVTQTVSSGLVSTIQKSHLRFVEHRVPVGRLADSTAMNHLQLVLKRSAARQAALDSLIADQHDPKSSRFHQWLSPQQFGESFGVADADIAAASAWLQSQGFTVNNVYPNKMQIDFSGNAGQVDRAFHTQENNYRMKNGSLHAANFGDVSIPAALRPVVTGVAGLNDFHPEALHKTSKLAQWDASRKGFALKSGAAKGTKGIGQSLPFPNPNNASGITRGLAPNDLATMYGFKTLRDNGVIGTGVTIAVVEDSNMQPDDWTNFRTVFNLARFTGGTFNQVHPAGPSACTNPDRSRNQTQDDGETLLDAEWATAVAPGANIVVASCADRGINNFFGGVFAAATNMINGNTRPNVISASYGFGEQFTDTASKTAIDLMWAQADAEGISVFVSTGDSGSNPSFNGGLINGYYGNTAVDANSFATSPNVTAVGGTDLADVIDGTTSQYFAPQYSAVGGSALSYVPEIPWNESCGNGVAGKALGYTRVVGFCNDAIRGNVPGGANIPYTSEAGSGGPSAVVAKPVWQRQVFNAAKDQSRDLPDVSLFAGSYGDNTYVITCTHAYACLPDFSNAFELSGGTSLSSPMFAGVQALIDQGLADRGVSANQGNAAPTLYALAANEYGKATGPSPASLATCNADNGATGTDNCVFHNVTRGSISSGCYSEDPVFTTPNCYYYATQDLGNGVTANIGLTTTDADPTGYTVDNKAFTARAGWSFATGLGSVNAKNLLIAWRAFVGAPSAPVASTTK